MDPDGARRGLHRAGGALRELHSPHHHPLDASLGRRRRGTRAARLQHRVQHHGADRGHPAHRHRQEERDHDDRLRARCAASGASARGSDLQRLAAALPSYHDDHDGGHAGRTAARIRRRRWGRNTPAARHLDRRWTDREPGAHALHHPRHVPLPRSLRALEQPAMGAGAPRAAACLTRSGATMRHLPAHSAATTRRSLVVALFTSVALAACAVGPNYHRPAAANPQRFKEAEGWKPAEPREAASGTDWWSVYGDATLEELEKQIDVSNQTLKASEAAWRQAVALVSQTRAGFFPTIGVEATGTRSGGPGGRSSASGSGSLVAAVSSHPVNQFQLLGTASWDLDIWGKIRRTLESNVASSQASEAELAAARLSAQATLASDYIQLRVADEQQHLLDETVAAFKRSLEITQNQYHVGVVAKADVITAETQLGGAQSQQIAIGVTRATLEHAIAVLIGKAPADFSLPPG